MLMRGHYKKRVGWWKGKVSSIGKGEQQKERVILSTANKTWNMKFVFINLRFRLTKLAFA